MAGDPIVLVSSPNHASPYIVGSTQGVHAYAVVGYNPSSSQPFEVFNPWGGSTSSIWCPIDHQVYGLFPASTAFLSQNFSWESLGFGAEPFQGGMVRSFGAEILPLTLNGSAAPAVGFSQAGQPTGLAIASNNSVLSTVPEHSEVLAVRATQTQEPDRSGSDAFWEKAGHPDSVADFLGRSCLLFRAEHS